MHTDAAGNPIEVGDHVVYGVTSGRSVVLKFGRVVALTSKMNWQGHAEDKISCITVDTDRWWGDNGPEWKLQKNGSPISIQLRTVMMIGPRQMPDEARKVLAAAYKARS